MNTEKQLENEGGETKLIEEEEKRERKICILQAVWFKKPDGSKLYNEYLALANPIAVKHGAYKVVGLVPREILRGGFRPDYLSIIEWPSMCHYYQFLKDPQYQHIASMRDEAIEKTIVIDCCRVS
ncbi:MAG TPA: DUF1330 domain-containing protein [Candidatus Hydrogenedens sp.]|nr:DUF1330 domain-containing protein [Candidatus Hydrogenedens sp.]